MVDESIADEYIRARVCVCVKRVKSRITYIFFNGMFPFKYTAMLNDIVILATNN